MAEIIKGSDLMVFKDGKSLAFATSCSLTLGTTTAAISSKDHGKWEASKPVKLNWEMSSDNLYTENDFQTLFTAWQAMEQVTVVFDVNGETPVNNADGTTVPATGWAPEGAGKGITGKAYITNISANAPDGDNATYSVTFTGAGNLTPYTI
jgi:hypothetical protein